VVHLLYWQAQTEDELKGYMALIRASSDWHVGAGGFALETLLTPANLQSAIGSMEKIMSGGVQTSVMRSVLGEMSASWDTLVVGVDATTGMQQQDKLRGIIGTFVPQAEKLRQHTHVIELLMGGKVARKVDKAVQEFIGMAQSIETTAVHEVDSSKITTFVEGMSERMRSLSECTTIDGFVDVIEFSTSSFKSFAWS
jgi:hypothetical protein